MKRAAITGERQAELVEAPDPRPKEDWAVVKVHAAGMCTEYKSFVAGHRSDYLGHEAVGEVAAIARPGRVKVGDRVLVLPQFPCGDCTLCLAGEYVYCEHSTDFAAFHGTREGSASMAQYLLKPDWLLPPIPEGMSYERAALANCALGPAFGGFRRMGLDRFDTVLITGAGPVGLGAIVVARHVGARVIVAEAVAYRAELAKKLGAEAVLDPDDEHIVGKIRDLTDGAGVDCACECAGYVPAQRLCIDAARRKGRIAWVGECTDELAIRVSPDTIRKGLAIFGSWYYNLNDVPPVMKIIQDSPLIDLLISHVIPMSRIQEAFELCASHQTAKVILKPWE